MVVEEVPGCFAPVPVACRFRSREVPNAEIKGNCAVVRRGGFIDGPRRDLVLYCASAEGEVDDGRHCLAVPYAIWEVSGDAWFVVERETVLL
jgi:hypothetical protein